MTARIRLRRPPGIARRPRPGSFRSAADRGPERHVAMSVSDSPQRRRGHHIDRAICPDSLDRALLDAATSDTPRWDIQRLRRVPVLGRRTELPSELRRRALADEARAEALPADAADSLDAEAMAQPSITRLYPKEDDYPAVLLGSPHGAAVHLAAALGAAWLPTTFAVQRVVAGRVRRGLGGCDELGCRGGRSDPHDQPVGDGAAGARPGPARPALRRHDFAARVVAQDCPPRTRSFCAPDCDRAPPRCCCVTCVPGRCWTSRPGTSSRSAARSPAGRSPTTTPTCRRFGGCWKASGRKLAPPVPRSYGAVCGDGR